MDLFLDTYLSLVNKNTPIIISLGKKISDKIFNKKCTKKDIINLISNLNNLKEQYKYKINYIPNVKTYKTADKIFTQYKNNVEYKIYEIIDTIVHNNCLHVTYINTLTDPYTLNSINNYDQEIQFNIMNININNNIDIEVKDYQTYYTIDLILKKPLQKKILYDVIETLFNI